jgi:hypothetical protein
MSKYSKDGVWGEVFASLLFLTSDEIVVLGWIFRMLKLHHMNLLNEIQETTLMMNLYQQQQVSQLFGNVCGINQSLPLIHTSLEPVSP